LKWKGKGQGKDKEIIIGFSEVKDSLQRIDVHLCQKKEKEKKERSFHDFQGHANIEK